MPKQWWEQYPINSAKYAGKYEVIQTKFCKRELLKSWDFLLCVQKLKIWFHRAKIFLPISQGFFLQKKKNQTGFKKLLTLKLNRECIELPESFQNQRVSKTLYFGWPLILKPNNSRCCLKNSLHKYWHCRGVLYWWFVKKMHLREWLHRWSMWNCPWTMQPKSLRQWCKLRCKRQQSSMLM